jgi:Nucleotidyl transferase AbiEii toxin, Type IV TA system
MEVPELADLRLVGGTALALLYGHRISVDIDLFSPNPLPGVLRKMIFEKGEDARIITDGNYYLAILDEGIKVDFVNWAMNFSPPKLIDGIRIADVMDIFAMKLDAITSRKTRKDFVDLELLFDKFGFEAGFNHYNKLYPYSKNSQIIIEAFAKINEADGTEMPNILGNHDWDATKYRLKRTVKKYFGY